MPEADPITPTTENIAEIDQILAVYADILMAAESLPEFTKLPSPNVIPCAPDDSDDTINNRITTAIAKNRGLCVLVMAGDGKNEDDSAPGPRITIDLEFQIFAAPIGKH